MYLPFPFKQLSPRANCIVFYIINENLHVFSFLFLLHLPANTRLITTATLPIPFTICTCHFRSNSCRRARAAPFFTKLMKHLHVFSFLFLLYLPAYAKLIGSGREVFVSDWSQISVSIWVEVFTEKSLCDF
ncbi:hypothetical protein LJC08_03420 [Methanimicrococcus sp. OttesenSCG-928-J09]|nr:hypothetical protein [Methanimicrococcus sp. OttesenSCG-928-J09]